MTTETTTPLNTVDDILDRCGGRLKVCYELDVCETAVRQWSKGGIPGDRWAYFLERGVTAGELYAATMKARGMKGA